MINKYKQGLLTAALYIGAVIGAGFATGQELLRYFVRFGRAGLWGIALCGLIFALAGFKTLRFMNINGLEDYSGFLGRIMGKRLGAAAEAISLCFFVVLYASMLAASGAAANEVLGINKLWGCGIMAVCCVISISRGVEHLSLLSLILSPLLIGGSLAVGLRLYLDLDSVPAFAPSAILDNAAFSALIYSSYNVISSVSLLCAASRNVKSYRDAFIGGAIGGITVAVIGLALALPLYKYFHLVWGKDLPLLSLMPHGAGRIGFIGLLGAAIFTTAAGSCCSIVECMSPKTKKQRIIYTVFVSAAALLLSLMGFQNIVGKIYFIFGFLGLAELSVILCLNIELLPKFWYNRRNKY